MSLKSINAALVSAFQSLGQSLPTSFEGKDFSAPSGDWVKVMNIPAVRFVNSLGDSGQDLVRGLFQIDYFVPENSGTGKIHGYMDQAIQHFKNGSVFTYSGQRVKVLRINMTNVRKDSATSHLTSSLSIYWESSENR